MLGDVVSEFLLHIGGVAGPSYDQEEPLRPKLELSLSGPALQGRMFQ